MHMDEMQTQPGGKVKGKSFCAGVLAGGWLTPVFMHPG